MRVARRLSAKKINSDLIETFRTTMANYWEEYKFPWFETIVFLVLLVIAIVVIVTQTPETSGSAGTSTGQSGASNSTRAAAAGQAASAAFLHTMTTPDNHAPFSAMLTSTEADGTMELVNRTVTLERHIQAKDLAMNGTTLHLNDWGLNTRHLYLVNSKIYGSNAESSLVETKSILLQPTSVSREELGKKLEGSPKSYDWIVCSTLQMDAASKIILGNKHLVLRSPTLPTIYGSPHQHVYFLLD